MTKYIEFELENGAKLLVESPDETEKGGSGFMRAGNGEAVKQAVATASQSLEKSFDSVRESANLLVNKLLSLNERPDEMEVNFALKVSADLGNFAIGTVGAEANYAVKLVWRKKEDKKEKDEG